MVSGSSRVVGALVLLASCLGCSATDSSSKPGGETGPLDGADDATRDGSSDDGQTSADGGIAAEREAGNAAIDASSDAHADGSLDDAGGDAALVLTIRGPRSYVQFKDGYEEKLFDPMRPRELSPGLSGIHAKVGTGTFDAATGRWQSTSLRYVIRLEQGTFYRFDAVIGQPFTKVAIAHDPNIVDLCGMGVVEDWADPLKSLFYYVQEGPDFDCRSPNITKVFRVDGNANTQPTTLPYVMGTALRDAQTGAISGWLTFVDDPAVQAPAMIQTDANYQNAISLNGILPASRTLHAEPGGVTLLDNNQGNGVSILRYDAQTRHAEPLLALSGMRVAEPILRDEAALYVRMTDTTPPYHAGIYYRLPIMSGAAVRIVSEADSELVALAKDHIVFRATGGLKVAPKLGSDVAGRVILPYTGTGSAAWVSVVRGDLIFFNDDDGGAGIASARSEQVVLYVPDSQWLPQRPASAQETSLDYALLMRLRDQRYRGATLHSFDTRTGKEGAMLGTIEPLGELLHAPEFVDNAGSSDTFMLSFKAVFASGNELYFGHGTQAGSLLRLSNDINEWHAWDVYRAPQ